MSSIGDTGFTGGFTLLPQGTNATDPASVAINQLPMFGGNNSGVISQVVYAIQAYGGFSTTQTFDNITRLPETMIAQYDVTGALEVLIPCSLFNARIGIVKHLGVVDNNVSVDYYDISANVLKVDSLTLTAEDFVAAIGNVNQIISVGNFSTIYNDFNNYVSQYFGFSSFTAGSEWGFGTLFTGELTFSTTQTNTDGTSLGTFQAAQFVKLLLSNSITGTAGTSDGTIADHNALNVYDQEKTAGLNFKDSSGGYITNLAGHLTVSGITKLLRNAVDANPFNNRGTQSPYWASDAHDDIDFGVTDGFYPNDLFFIPTQGFKITLKLNIDTEAFTSPLNNINQAVANGQGANFISNTTNDGLAGTTTGSTITGAQTATTTTSRTVTTTLLERVVTAPLLIRLQETGGVDTSGTALSPVYNHNYSATNGAGNTMVSTDL